MKYTSSNNKKESHSILVHINSYLEYISFDYPSVLQLFGSSLSLSQKPYTQTHTHKYTFIFIYVRTQTFSHIYVCLCHDSLFGSPGHWEWVFLAYPGQSTPIQKNKSIQKGLKRQLNDKELNRTIL